MNARSALFDAFGDHLRTRGGQAPVSALVTMMSALGIAAPAVRTAISRMVVQGWLDPVRVHAAPGYKLTPRAERRLSEAASRIYRTGPAPWDGSWHLLVLPHVADRVARERIRSGLAYLGYAQLRDATWISPRQSVEVVPVLQAEGVSARIFTSRFDGDDARLARETWDLKTLEAHYRGWLDAARALLASEQPSDDKTAFVVRTALVHEWRKFLFSDPGLPDALLPADWAGRTAGGFFHDQARRLLPAAGRYVDACLRSDAR